HRVAEPETPRLPAHVLARPLPEPFDARRETRHEPHRVPSVSVHSAETAPGTAGHTPAGAWSCYDTFVSTSIDSGRTTPTSARMKARICTCIRWNDSPLTRETSNCRSDRVPTTTLLQSPRKTCFTLHWLVLRRG